MSWKRKPKKDWVGEKDKLFDFLIDLDFEENKVVQYSEYHTRIFGRKVVDVWAGSKKYFVRGSIGSKEYESLEELKEYLV